MIAAGVSMVAVKVPEFPHGNMGYIGQRAAFAAPDSIAIIDLWGDRERILTHGALEARLERVANLAASLGLAAGSRVALAMPNRSEWLEVFFGVMRAGLVPVPLNIRQGMAALEHCVRDSGAKAAFYDPTAFDGVADLFDHLPKERRFGLDGAPDAMDYAQVLAAMPEDFSPIVLPPDHMSFMPYTSGSTGLPKGVVLTHAGQIWWIRARQRYWPFDVRTRAAVAVPLYHKNAMAGAVKPLLFCGGSFVLMPGFEPRGFLKALAGYRCTRAGAVPAVYSLLLRERDLLEELDFSALTALSMGSAPVQAELLEEVKRVFGVYVRESYGLTEGGPVMIGPPVDGRPAPYGSCGVAWPEGEVKLMDADGKEHPSDGELWVRNPGVTPGYHNLPEVNARRLQDGWLATGDLFHRDAEGFFFFRGRTDEMFKCAGESVYPKEVENLLLTHPAVSEACVVPLPYGGKGQAPVAFVVPYREAEVDAEALKAHCLEHGAPYAHPRRIHIAQEMPLTGAGKQDRKAIASVLTDLFAAELAGGEGR